jgi:hypothetical protein
MRSRLHLDLASCQPWKLLLQCILQYRLRNADKVELKYVRKRGDRLFKKICTKKVCFRLQSPSFFREIEPLLREIFDLNLPFPANTFKHHST